MRLGKMLGIAGLVIAVLCASAQNVRAQDSGKKPDVPTVPGARPGGETKEGSKKDVEKKDIEKKSSPPEMSVEIQWLKAFEGILDKLLSWVLVALVFVVLFRGELKALFNRVTQEIADRGFTLEAGKVSIKLSERALDLYEDRSTRFSVSPFDVEKDPFEGFSASSEVPPQLTFQVSDYVGSKWTVGKSALTQNADKAFSALKDQFEKVRSLDNVMSELSAFAEALEKSRFVGASRLKNLLDHYPKLRSELVALASTAPAGARERLVLHAAGASYSQSGKWTMACSLLKPIAWGAGDRPEYLPAGDTWLASMYHERIEAARSPTAPIALGAFLKAVVDTADDVLAKARLVADAMAVDVKWSPHNAGYYRREIQKLIGLVASLSAEYSDMQTKKQELLQRAFDAYAQCTTSISGEEPTALDYNNLADIYRQLGRTDRTNYQSAHEAVSKALKDDADDPTFLNTQALIYVAEEKRLDALQVLITASQENMAQRNPQDVVQYVNNQILAAKIVSGTDRPQPVRFCQAADILEGAARFLGNQAARLDETDVTLLTTELNELLGFTYLGLSGYERRSVECFECVGRFRDKASATAEIHWRRWLGSVRAHTRLARVSRRDFDYGTSADQRKRGRKIVDGNLAELEAFRLEGGQPDALRLRHARVRSDTAMALQGLAEESFLGGEFGDSKVLLDKKDAIIATLVDFREHEEIGSRVQLATAHTGLLRGRLAFARDPGTYEPSVLTEIERNLLDARGHSAMLDCQVDLALGAAFLAGALAGKGNVAANYRKAIDALELAVGRNAPALRADATRALVDAYAKRGVVRSVKDSKRPA